MELKCKAQNYDWGKLGQESIVANLLSSSDPQVEIDVNKPYAELWIGTHPNGPSLIVERDILLSEYLKDNVDAIGPVVKRNFGVTVPFLLKVLSIRKALSIQAHPTKEHAEQLHASFPDMYKDPNHKPELAIALTDFEGLCGFRPIQEIKVFLKKLPELSEILSKSGVEALLNYEEGAIIAKLLLKEVFQSLMICDKNVVANSLEKLMKRLSNADPTTQSDLLYKTLQKLYTEFPGDVGCYGPYFMNLMQLRPGQAFFLKPNLPHAYLNGDCVECMACSDNVVRAGLTPKFIDVTTLVDMLDYSSYSPSELLFNPTIEDENSCIWRPPVPDFAVVKIRVANDSYNTIIRASPSLILFITGEGVACDTEPVQVRPGSVLFLKASRQLTITAEPGRHLEAYQAICNV